MNIVQDIISEAGKEYLEKFGAQVPGLHRKLISDVSACRSGDFGGFQYYCTHCQKDYYAPRSCGNRSCPLCFTRKRLEWQLKVKEMMFPAPFFHLVFTLPSELYYLSRQHQKVCLGVLFQASAKVLKQFSADPQLLGGTLGHISVLHTWGDRLNWHPHVHILCSGLALSKEHGIKEVDDPRFLFSVKAMSIVFRAIYLKMLKKALPKTIRIPYCPKSKNWVVYCDKVEQKKSSHLIDYLGRYIFRGPIDQHRIIKRQGSKVTFKYRKREGKKVIPSTMTLSEEEFLRRYLQHVPQKGLNKVRYYGLFHPAHKRDLLQIQMMLFKGDALDDRTETILKAKEVLLECTQKLCPCCQKPLTLWASLDRQQFQDLSPPIEQEGVAS